MKLSWHQALSDASQGKNARPGPPQRAQHYSLEDLLNASLSSTVGYVSS